MINYPYDYNFGSPYRETPSYSYIRVFHAVPNAPSVDVFINDNLAVRGLSYKGFSPYLRTSAGRHNIKIFPAGQRTNPIINTDINVPARSIMTVSAIGTLPNISLLPISEPQFARIPGKAYIRFAHLSPNAPNVDVITQGIGKSFSNVGYKTVTNYIPINPGIYAFDINSTQTGQRVLYVPNIRLLPNRIYTIYAVGLAGGTPPLQVVIPLDGNTYLKV